MPVKKLLDMNDVALSWKRFYSTYPELDNIHEPSEWTRDEMAKMPKHARNPMDRALLPVLASSRVRAGAPSPVNRGDLTPVYLVDGKLTTDPRERGDRRASCWRSTGDRRRITLPSSPRKRSMLSRSTSAPGPRSGVAKPPR